MGMADRLSNNDYKHTSMIITDMPELGLQFKAITSVKADGVELIYNPALLDTTGRGFELTLPANLLATYAGKDLVITYNMYLDNNANPDVDINNVATVSVSDILTDEDNGPEVYTGGKRFIKVDKDSQGNTLADAVFVVRNGDEEDSLYLAIDANGAVSWVADLALAKRFKTLANGMIDIRGLEFGTYYLEEIEAPEGFVIGEELIEFQIFRGSYHTVDGLVTPTTVVNIRKGRLPSTGGSGIVGIVGIGLVLITTTGGYYLKRRSAE